MIQKNPETASCHGDCFFCAQKKIQKSPRNRSPTPAIASGRSPKSGPKLTPKIPETGVLNGGKLFLRSKKSKKIQKILNGKAVCPFCHGASDPKNASLGSTARFRESRVCVSDSGLASNRAVVVGGDPTPTQHTHTQTELPSCRGECHWEYVGVGSPPRVRLGRSRVRRHASESRRAAAELRRVVPE